MKCAICGMEIDSIDEAIKEGWIPYFYEREKEHEFACPDCAEVYLQSGKDKEMELKEEYLGKIKYLDEKPEEHLAMWVMLKSSN